MSRLTLERYQVWAYLIAIGLGLAVGTAWPGIGPAMETLLWPTLAALLFATFLQVPLLHVRDALRDRRAHSGDGDRQVRHHEHPQQVSSVSGRKRPEVDV